MDRPGFVVKLHLLTFSGNNTRFHRNSSDECFMAYDFERAIERLRGKTAMVAKRYRVAIDQRDAARRDVKRLEDELLHKDREIKELKMKIEYLSVVTSARPSADEMKRSRAMLSELVREIDQCISDLQS